jgi:hypothetical protein
MSSDNQQKAPLSAEHARLAEGSAAAAGGDWKLIGPYVADRAWGTVREDYSADGDAWGYFPFDDARSRAFRWSEDGLAGLCDREQRLCFALSFWNGRDPILKERIFGLSGSEGNHGEDAKEYWWSLDATPTYILDALARSLSASRISVCAAAAGERQPHKRPAGIRASRHRRVRRGSILANHRGLRQGGAG